MITISTKPGSFYFSDFVHLVSDSSEEVDETLLGNSQLKDLVVAIHAGRLLVSEDDLLKVTTLFNKKGDVSLDLSFIEDKEDKVNKVDSFTGNLSTVKYPSTQAVVDYINGSSSGYVTTLALNEALTSALIPYAKESTISTLATKASLATYATTASLSNYALKTSLTDYTTTAALTLALQPYSLKSDLTPYAKTVALDGYVSKTSLGVASGVATLGLDGNVLPSQLPSVEVFTPIVIENSTVPGKTTETVPLFTLDNTGTYVLCTPDKWIQMEGVYLPAYTAATLGIVLE